MTVVFVRMLSAQDWTRVSRFCEEQNQADGGNRRPARPKMKLGPILGTGRFWHNLFSLTPCRLCRVGARNVAHQTYRLLLLTFCYTTFRIVMKMDFSISSGNRALTQ